MDNKFNITNEHLWRTDITNDNDGMLKNIDEWCQIDFPNDKFEAIRNIYYEDNRFIHYMNYINTGTEGIQIEYYYEK